MGLDQIALMLGRSSARRHQALDAHLADIDARIRALEASRAMAQHALECRAHDVTTCPDFRRRLEQTIEGTAHW